MASKVKDVLRLIGRRPKDTGSTIYHAIDGAHDGGMFTAGARHKIRLALHKKRLRASGMTDDILGSKEVGGTMTNPYENEKY